MNPAYPATVPAASAFPWRRLAPRTLLLTALLGAEALLASLFLDGASLLSRSGLLTQFIAHYGAWSVKGSIGFAALFVTFAYLRYKPALAVVSVRLCQMPLRPAFFAAHGGAIALFAALSALWYGNHAGGLPPDALAAPWLAAGCAAVIFAGLAIAPPAIWAAVVRATGRLWLFAAAASFAACLAGALAWRLWHPAARLTFQLVQWLLRPFLSDMLVLPSLMRIGTRHFSAIIAPECSGLEGMALMLIFSVLWLLLFREEIRFPHALVLVPAGVAALFLLNGVRIAALILIGNAGAREVAARGFHSQAGWIAFNLVALGLSAAARRVSWFANAKTRAPRAAREVHEYPAAPYLLPVLALLAAGMLSRAFTGSFEWTYPLRLVAGLAAFWYFRRDYAALGWRFGWFGFACGAVVFILWIALDPVASTGHAAPMPFPLAAASPVARLLWITCRALAAIFVVPLAEELAFRGFLLRRLVAAGFEAVPYGHPSLLPVLVSSLLFGLMHGNRWFAGTLAGLIYALAARWRGQLGEAVAAHAVTNALLAAYVLFYPQWALW